MNCFFKKSKVDKICCCCSCKKDNTLTELYPTELLKDEKLCSHIEDKYIQNKIKVLKCKSCGATEMDLVVSSTDLAIELIEAVKRYENIN